MNRVEIRGGPYRSDIKIRLNGEELQDCTRIALWGDAESDEPLSVTITLMAKVDVDVEARLEVIAP